MRTQYDTLLRTPTPAVEKPSSSKSLWLAVSALIVGALLVAVWTVNPEALANITAFLVDGEDVGEDLSGFRVVYYMQANDVLTKLSDSAPLPTHLILTDIKEVPEENAEAIKEQLSALQATGMSVLLGMTAKKVEELRTDFPTYHAELTAAIVEWKADGVDMDGTKCPSDAGYLCSTADLMRLVASIRADMPRDFIITVSPGAHQVFGSEHASRQVLRDLVLKQEVNDEIDWLNVHFAAGWTEDLGQKIVKSMEASEYEAETIVPIVSFGADEADDFLSLDEMKEKFGLSFGGFGTDYTNKDLYY